MLAALFALPLSAQENAVKLTFLSWFSGSTKISYERAFPSCRQSGEICTSLIGAGYDKYDNNPSGFTARYGHKFFVGMYDDARPLCGVYVRPEFIWSRYTYDSSQAFGNRKLAQMCALIASAGMQWAFGHFIADAWFGGGPAVGTPSETLYHHGFELWHWAGTTNENVAMSFSIRLGYCF